MLHFFHTAHHVHVARFCVVMFSCCTFFRVALFLGIALFHFILLQVTMFSFCNSGFCNFFLLHFVHYALFPELLPGSPQTSTMWRFARIITKAVKHCCKVLFLKCSWGSGYASAIFMLHFFHVALIPCRTFFMLHSCCTLFPCHVALFSCCTCLLLKNIANERKAENTTKKRSYT